MSGFSIELTINEKLYLRDPQRSDVGRRVLRHAILLMDEIGLESFTFKNWQNKPKPPRPPFTGISRASTCCCCTSSIGTGPGPPYK